MDRLISEKSVMEVIYGCDWFIDEEHAEVIKERIKSIPSAEPKTVHCKDCKYFEYDHVARPSSGIPIIVAHEICSRWGDGCKTKEDGYCFLFESQESEDKE